MKIKNLIFFPTSPVHVHNLSRLRTQMPEWKFYGIFFNIDSSWTNGIEDSLEINNFPFFKFNSVSELASLNKIAIDLVIIGAVFEPIGFHIFVWAQKKGLKVIAFQEVAQLSLNNNKLNNYDLPFDRLFIANLAEKERFIQFGFPRDQLIIIGLLSNDSLEKVRLKPDDRKNEIRKRLNISSTKKIILYTTSPLRNRFASHAMDDRSFRNKILAILYNNAEKLGIEIIVKLHPNEKLQTEKLLYKKYLSKIHFFGGELDIVDLLLVSDLVINRGNSQTALDAAILGFPLIILDRDKKSIFKRYNNCFFCPKLSMLINTIAKANKATVNIDDNFNKNYYITSKNGVVSNFAIEINKVESTPKIEVNWEWIVRSGLFFSLETSILTLIKEMNHKTEWLSLVQNALQFELDGDFVSSAKIWEKVIKLDLSWFFPHFKVAFHYNLLSQYDLSILNIDHAISKHPTYHKLWHEIPLRILAANILINQNRHRESLNYINKLNPKVVWNRPDALLSKAKCYSYLKKKESCLKFLYRISKLLEDYPLSNNEESLLHHNTGLLWGYYEQWDKAIIHYNKSIQIDPEFSWSYYERALINITLGYSIHALRDFRKAFECESENSILKLDLFLTLSKAYEKLFTNFYSLRKDTDHTIGNLNRQIDKLNQNLEHFRSEIEHLHNTVRSLSPLQEIVSTLYLDKIISDFETRDFRVGIFGAGKHTEMLLKQTRIKELNIVAIFDNNKDKWGESIDCYVITSPEKLNYFNLDAILISSCISENNIFQQLCATVDQKTKIFRIYSEAEALSSNKERPTLPFHYEQHISELHRSFATVHLDFPCCPICKYDKFETLFSGDRHDLGLNTQMCLYCGMLMLRPRPDYSWYEKFYKDFFWNVYVGHRFLNLEDLYKNDCLEEKAQYILDNCLDDLPEQGNYLDFGSGLGAMLHMFKQKYYKWNVTGFEIGIDNANFSKNKFNLKIINEYPHHFPRNWDLISSIHVFEHILNPIEVLSNFYNKLSDQGMVYIEVPDFLSSQWNGKSFIHIAHPLLFDSDSLTKLSHIAGFNIIKIFRDDSKKRFWKWSVGMLLQKNPKIKYNRIAMKADNSLLLYKRKWMKERASS
jgi:tetratricopeptide (TPR) repeat protein